MLANFSYAYLDYNIGSKTLRATVVGLQVGNGTSNEGLCLGIVSSCSSPPGGRVDKLKDTSGFARYPYQFIMDCIP